MAEVVRILGANWCPDCKRAKQFLADQRVPYRFIDVEQDQAAHREVMERNGGKLIIPVIEFPDGSILIEPDNSEIAATLKLEITASKSLWELIVVGAGPAGLTSAIYAAREGIDTLVLDKGALGGQAGATERVENYPGFPEGISGGELASRYVEHARRYGVEMLSGVQVRRISREDDGLLAVNTDQGETYRAKAVVVATGSTYRRLDVPGEEDLIGAGIHFCATCDGPFYRGAKDLVVIGGGNSGLEEGLFLSQFAEKITVLQDLPNLTASAVLQERVINDPRFEVRTSTKVRKFLADADGRLDAVEVETPKGIERIEADGAFIFIGLTPNSGFVEGTLDLGGAGFVATRQTLETNLAGVFAAGDVREGSTKQIASAVGEGAAVALMVRAYLNSQAQ
ncbi:MAG: FAD-dependent oxidoreductase [Actinomycetota bacterium]|jgi:thioredoxin reductase (NADPH)|nr:FAD-dependent oxidoreductase [Actinomycetota bacterium]